MAAQPSAEDSVGKAQAETTRAQGPRVPSAGSVRAAGLQV